MTNKYLEKIAESSKNDYTTPALIGAGVGAGTLAGTYAGELAGRAVESLGMSRASKAVGGLPGKLGSQSLTKFRAMLAPYSRAGKGVYAASKIVGPALGAAGGAALSYALRNNSVEKTAESNSTSQG